MLMLHLIHCSVELWCCPLGDIFIRDEAVQGNLLFSQTTHVTLSTLHKGGTRCQHGNLFKKW